ncbi:disease resistance protein RPM1-like [Phragmites australis]|uniref:disease resistance protein RPM1-like n=1 Tax=Phragmites australis TaxID=29695 RepID=UPI002D7A0C9B|nr:disease resistance protein RPM1-like [Phragmites australis]
MAENIAISLSAKLGVALSRSAANGLSALFGVRSDIATASQDLVLLRTFLRFADSHHGTDVLAAEWVKQVRDAAFELEDVADECCYLSGHGLFWDIVNVKSWFALSRRLRKARERLLQLSADKEQFGIRPANGPASPVDVISRTQAESAHFLEKEEIVGFTVYEKQLLEWVIGDVEPRLTLVAVCGMGGVGKTTLVTRVYKEVATSHFDCAAWVAVSQGFTMDDLLRKILKELNRDAPVRVGNDADADYRSLVAAVRGHLGKRRYLVVLDDIWDEHLWGKHLRHAFLDDATGSRVVITTRSRDVVKAAPPERIMMLEPLPWSEAWMLFCNVTFRTEPGRTCPSNLEELAVNMLERCRGLPLAIVSISNLLALKEKTEFSWRNVCHSLVWDKSSSDLGIGEAASILNLSIDHLPHHLKRCFLSCSIYPEDFLIKRKILIRNWVAQGFVDDKPDQCTAEDVADGYLDQLVQRSLMKAVYRNESGRVKRCLIHDLIRELIIRRSREEEGYFQFANHKITMDINIRVRHLAVDRCEKVDCQSVPKVALLRSFHAFASELDVTFLSRFRLLTVLNLWFVEMKKLPDSVTNLHNMRYLGIRTTLIEELPKDLGKLQKLQTLDAKLSMVQRLPSSTAKLKSLRHLILFRREAADLSKPYPGTVVGAPEGLENLTSLQTLKYVRADMKTVTSLARLEQMRSLEIFGVDASLTTDLSFSISRMSCLVRLGLEMKHGADVVLDLESITQPPLKLQKLALAGRLAGGKLPSWTSSLTSLVQLQLCHCDIAQDSLLLLAALPGLVNLSLIATYHDRAMIFPGGSFSTLQKLILKDMPNLSRIVFQQGCLVKLRDLVLSLCTELTETPQGMENLMHLQSLKTFGMPTEFVDKLKEQSGDAGYYKPAKSEFPQALGPSRYLSWVGRNK